MALSIVVSDPVCNCNLQTFEAPFTSASISATSFAIGSDTNYDMTAASLVTSYTV